MNRTAVIPPEFMEKVAELEKQGVLFAAAIPLIVKAALGLATAHGIYSGAKDIAKGNYGSGIFNLATMLPFIGWAGKGLKATGSLARLLSRGGRVGNLATRASSKFTNPAATAAYKETLARAAKYNLKPDYARRLAARAAANVPAQEPGLIGRALGAASDYAGRGYQYLGAGGTSTPISQLPAWWRPVAGSLRHTSRAFHTAGKSVERLGNAIAATPYGKFAHGRYGLAAMIGGPIVYEALAGSPMPQDNISKYIHPTMVAGSHMGQYIPDAQRYFNQGMPAGFEFRHVGGNQWIN